MQFPRFNPGRTLLVLAFLLASGGAACAQGEDYLRANYTKYEYNIPMRDGVRLFTSVYVPKDTSRRYPIMLERTPYGIGPYGVDKYRDNLGPSSLFGKSGYIVAYQDVRGCYMSEGDFVDMRPYKTVKIAPREIDENTDATDTITWLLKNIACNNGRVGMWGVSYPGFYAASAMLDAHPALKAVSPQAPCIDWFLGDDTHHNGALCLHQEFNYDVVFGTPRPKPTTKDPPPFDHGSDDAYAFFLALGPVCRADQRYFKGQRAFWNETMKHGTYDAFWKERSLLPHLKNVKPAVLTVGGWYDAEDLFGTLQAHRSLQKSGPKAENFLVMGPWDHGGWSGSGESLGHVNFGAKTAEFYRERFEFPFFEHHLKERGDWTPPKALMFETGKNRWHCHDEWPPKEAKSRSLYLQAGGKLAFSLPEKCADAAAYDQFVSDPARPVPYTDTVAIDYPRAFMVEDQRFATRRPDVVTYRTDVLTEDVTVAGPIRVELHVSTTGTDADWVVKLIDVYPADTPDPKPNPSGVRMGGYQQMVRGDVMRGKFRKSFEKPEAFEPGEPAIVPFTMSDIYHTFRAGHRIQVQVQSSWFPLMDRNPQTFVDIYTAKEADFRKATQRVYHSAERASRLELPVVP
jgi:putative CocE/NonD family hydrolase